VISMRKIFTVIGFHLLLLLFPLMLGASVFELEVDDIIHPVSAEYIIQGITKAEAEKAEAIIIRLSTPGGLDQSMREIIEKILASKVPVIVYVAPSGVRAASAGFYILLSADLAVMAPGTNTGAAHPVMLGGGKIDEVMNKKVENDAAAYLRSFASKRGRNAELAEKGVIESKSFTESEALQQHLIDGIAKSTEDLLNQFDGKVIQRFDGSTHRLKLKGESLYSFPMSARQKLLTKILDPNIAIILGVIGLMGLYIEFTHPGFILPGVLGAVCLFLAMVALNILPINFLGVVLIVGAIVLFVLEAKVTSYGILAVLGMIAMVLGSLILIDSPIPELKVRLATSIGITLPFAAITIFLMRLVILSHRKKSVTGEEGMIGEIGLALTEIQEQGKVRVHGEIWEASSSLPIHSGDKVKIRAVSGMRVEVEKV
jgi:membrane-bound serine protease (ClpP class)